MDCNFFGYRFGRLGPSTILLLSSVFLIIAVPKCHGESENEHLILAIGQTEALDIPESSNLNVNRKGIIDVQFIEDSKWQVTGLKEGFAIISIPGHSAEERIFVEVRKNRVTKPPVPNLYEKICQRKGFQCDPGTTLLRGEISDYLEYMWAKRLCLHIPNCDFQATLDEQSRKSAEIKLQTLLQSKYQVIFNANAYGLILVPCGDRDVKTSSAEIDTLSGGMVTSKELTIICRDQYLKTTYRFKSKILVVDNADSLEFGSNVTESSKISFKNDRLKFFTEAEFRALSKNNNVRIAGEPLLRLIEGSETIIESGGEFPVLKTKSEDGQIQETSWKQYGLALKVKAMSESNESITVQIDFSVRTPGGGSNQNNLQLNRLVSVVRAHIGTPVVVGGVEIETAGAKEQFIPLLSALPIIGPLFQLASKEHANSKLFLWILLDKDSGDANPGVGLAKFPEPVLHSPN